MSRTIYVGNVSAAIDENSLRALFQHFGAVTEVRIAGQPNYNSKYAFVEFQTEQQALQALSLNGLHLADRDIRVSMAKQSSNSGGMSAANMGMYGMQAGMYGFAGAAAYGGMGYAGMMGGGGGGGGRFKMPTPQEAERIAKTIHVDNVDSAITEFQMAQFFGVFGPVIAVRLAGNPSMGKRKAWVEFQNGPAAQAAFQMDNQTLGMLPIRITPSKSVIHTNGLTITPAMQQEMAKQAQQVAAAHSNAAATSADEASGPIGPEPRTTTSDKETEERGASRRSRSRSPVRRHDHSPREKAADEPDSDAQGTDTKGDAKVAGGRRREEKEADDY